MSCTIWAENTRGPVLSESGTQFEAEYGIPVVVVEKGFGDIRDDLKVAGPAAKGPIS
jgi:maltose/maltodextrin transport system substrate-binding protein/arabinogalactan oligomer/maltooligosaccharide transport system substrate-binding protein